MYLKNWWFAIFVFFGEKKGGGGGVLALNCHMNTITSEEMSCSHNIFG
jgi:hypothetical protein